MKSRAAIKPRQLLRGKKVTDFRTGEELFENDSNTWRQDGGYVHKKNYDTWTEEQRANQIQGMMR